MDLTKAIELYQSGISVPQIAKNYNIPQHKLYYELKKRKLTRSHIEKSRKFIANFNFFENIDSEIKAYWLGYMFSDGYISSSNGYRVGITSKDIEHLSLFIEDLSATYPVKIYESETSYGTTRYGRVLIASQKMYDDLTSHGCVEHKSKKLRPPNLEKKFERYFIRGMYDGDGSIKKSKNAKSGYSLSIVGTKEIIEWIKHRISGSVWHDQKKDIWYLDTSITLEILDYLYDKNARSLQRKLERVILARQKLSGIT